MVVINASEEGGYHVWCPSLPGCHSQGETLQAAKKNIVEAIQCHMESMIKEGLRPAPVTEEFIGSVEIPLSA